jgi:hypothetical protein
MDSRMRSSATAMHPLHCRVSHGSVVYVLTLSPSSSCVKFDGEVRRGGTILLTGMHFAHVGTHCINQAAGRRFRRLLRAGLIMVVSSSSGLVLDCYVPRRVSGCSVGLISFIAGAANHQVTSNNVRLPSSNCSTCAVLAGFIQSNIG